MSDRSPLEFVRLAPSLEAKLTAFFECWRPAATAAGSTPTR